MASDPKPSDGATAQASRTETVHEEPGTASRPEETLHLRFQPRTEESRQVRWATGVVDNENMGKKTSKCCCIYKKPREWDESETDESEEEGETCHCRGHVEKKWKKHDDDHDNGHNHDHPEDPKQPAS